MKVAICGDIHISKTSSILKSRGDKYSTRIENCIKSINWFEQIAKEYNCELEVYLGDTFDKPNLDDEILTAIKDIKWNELTKYFIVGNHESSVNGLEYNSVKSLESADIWKSNSRYVIAKPDTLTLDLERTQLHFIPYVIETDRQPIKEYLYNYDNTCDRHIIFSHNDIKGIQMGPVVSKVGFDIKEIEDNCDMFINGHLHNGEKVTDKIINLGILTGQNFGENANMYKHEIMILDTDTLNYELIENPYAFNFYNIEINNTLEITKLGGLKSNAIVSIKCNIELLDAVKETLQELHNIIQYRITTFRVNKDINEVEKVEDFSVDYLEKFKEFCLLSIGNNEIVNQELCEVIK